MKMKTEKTIIYKKVHCMSFGYQKMLRAIFKYAAYRGIHTLKRGFADLIKTDIDKLAPLGDISEPYVVLKHVR